MSYDIENSNEISYRILFQKLPGQMNMAITSQVSDFTEEVFTRMI